MIELQKQIDELKAQVNLLTQSSTIPRDVQTAFAERLATISVTGTSTALTQSVSVPSTPTNITVPAQPSGTLTVEYKGVVYNLLYK